MQNFSMCMHIHPHTHTRTHTHARIHTHTHTSPVRQMVVVEGPIWAYPALQQCHHYWLKGQEWRGVLQPLWETWSAWQLLVWTPLARIAGWNGEMWKRGGQCANELLKVQTACGHHYYRRSPPKYHSLLNNCIPIQAYGPVLCTLVGEPRTEQILKIWSTEPVPGNSGLKLYTSAMMEPTAQMSMGEL